MAVVATLPRDSGRSGIWEIKLLPCLFAYRGEDGEILGMLGVHVDDIILCGDLKSEFAKKVSLLREQLTFGKWEDWEFTYTGRRIRQDRKTYEVYVSQPEYAEMNIEHPSVARDRARTDPVTREEKKLLRSVGGAGCWLARQSRPDLFYEVSRLQQNLPTATVQQLHEANLLRKRACEVQYEIKIGAIDLEDLHVVMTSDASPGTMPRGGRQAGYFVLLSDSRIRKKVHTVCPAAWSSHKLKRVARSSLATEAMGLCEGIEAAEYMRCALRELLDPTYDLKTWETAAEHIPILACTDAQSLYDHLRTDGSIGKDRIFALDAAALRQFFDANNGRNAEVR